MLDYIKGSHHTGTTLKTWNFVIYFSRPGKCLEFAQKVGKTWNFNSQPWKNFKLVNLEFKDLLFKMSFTKKIIYIFVISTLSPQALIQSQIDLGFYCFYLEITWKIHRSLYHQRSGNPDIKRLIYWKPYSTLGVQSWNFEEKKLLSNKGGYIKIVKRAWGREHFQLSQF